MAWCVGLDEAVEVGMDGVEVLWPFSIHERGEVGGDGLVEILDRRSRARHGDGSRCGVYGCRGCMGSVAIKCKKKRKKEELLGDARVCDGASAVCTRTDVRFSSVKCELVARSDRKENKCLGLHSSTGERVWTRSKVVGGVARVQTINNTRQKNNERNE